MSYSRILGYTKRNPGPSANELNMRIRVSTIVKCFFLRICVCVHVCTYPYVCIHVCTYVCLCLCVHMYKCVPVCTHVCISAHAHVYKRLEVRAQLQLLFLRHPLPFFKKIIINTWPLTCMAFS